LLKIDHSTFDQMVHENPEIAVRMLRKLSHRLRRSQGAAPTAPLPTTSAEAGPIIGSRAVLLHEETKSEFELSPGAETTIGRRDRVTGFSPGIDFGALDMHRTLSRRHAKILRRTDGFYLQEEIGTSNGTFVNGEKIKKGVPVRLCDGDEVKLGVVCTRFHYDKTPE
jgi:pSer/pThr/pTyr-binding forkhead associated (FHA) protein